MNAFKQNTSLPSTSEDIKYQVTLPKDKVTRSTGPFVILFIMSVFFAYGFGVKGDESAVTFFSCLGIFAAVGIVYNLFRLHQLSTLEQEILRVHAAKQASASSSNSAKVDVP